MEPLIKWAGGKRQLLPELVPRMPVYYRTYYEPFFGGGALALKLMPDRLVINDRNAALVNLYTCVRDHPDDLMAEMSSVMDTYQNLSDLDAKRAYYNNMRQEYNSGSRTGVRAAVLLVFLNKAGFNGMYRVNSRNEFNIPFGKHESVKLFNRENFKAVSRLLQRADILCGDFENAVRSAGAGDFVFFDSPYYDTFDKYQPNGFSEGDHRRLAGVFRDLSQAGVKCMLTNSDTAFIRELYDDYRIETVDVRRSVNRDGNHRTGVEVIIRNYS